MCWWPCWGAVCQVACIALNTMTSVCSACSPFSDAHALVSCSHCRLALSAFGHERCRVAPLSFAQDTCAFPLSVSRGHVTTHFAPKFRAACLLTVGSVGKTVPRGKSVVLTETHRDASEKSWTRAKLQLHEAPLAHVQQGMVLRRPCGTRALRPSPCMRMPWRTMCAFRVAIFRWLCGLSSGASEH